MARQLQASNPLPVAVRHKNGGIRTHPMWENNPRIVKPGFAGEFQWLDSRGGNRPYIDYFKSSTNKWHWKPYRCEPGEIYLSEYEKGFATLSSGYVIIEPNIKAGAPRNKDWGFDHWQKLADWLKKFGVDVMQMGPSAEPKLKRLANYVETRDIRQACGVLSGARGIITAEGGLHHCAAALGIPAVVIRGGFIGPEVTGYDGQVNFFTPTSDHPHGCGWRVNCAHCRSIMDSINPREVGKAALQLIGEKTE